MYLLPSSVLPTLFTQMVDVLQISVGLFRLGKRWTLLFLPNKTSRWGQGWFSPTSSPLCSDSQIKSWCETLHSGIMWRDVAHIGLCLEQHRWLSAPVMPFQSSWFSRFSLYPLRRGMAEAEFSFSRNTEMTRFSLIRIGLSGQVVEFQPVWRINPAWKMLNVVTYVFSGPLQYSTLGHYWPWLLFWSQECFPRLSPCHSHACVAPQPQWCWQ